MNTVKNEDDSAAQIRERSADFFDTPENRNESSMCLQENRLKSFADVTWPFSSEDDNCLCTPSNLAEAGFYFCGTDQDPDSTKCFACGKELNCWDPEDDPWVEHKKHSSKCPFICLNMKEDDMKIIDFLKLIKDIQLWKVTKITNAAFEEFKKQTDEVREVIKQLLVVSEHEEQSS